MDTDLAKRLPEDLGYVVVHELFHFVAPNHGKGFVVLMDNFIPGWRKMRAEMNGTSFRRLKRRSEHLSGNDTKTYNLSKSSVWKTTPDSYGHVKVTSGANGQFIARLLRGKSLTTTPEFTYSTPVR